MAGGDGDHDVAVVTEVAYFRIPTELMFLVRRYQSASRTPSLTQAFKHLLETHPLIVQMAHEMYDVSATPGGPRESR